MQTECLGSKGQKVIKCQELTWVPGTVCRQQQELPICCCSFGGRPKQSCFSADWKPLPCPRTADIAAFTTSIFVKCAYNLLDAIVLLLSQLFDDDDDDDNDNNNNNNSGFM